MKVRRQFAWTMAIAFSLAIFAQAQGGPGGRKRRGPPSVDSRLQRMTKNLNLTEEQQKKLRPLLENQQKQMQALRQDTSLSRQQRRQKMREIQKEFQQKSDPILTPEQQKKRNEMRQRAFERWRGRRS